MPTNKYGTLTSSTIPVEDWIKEGFWVNVKSSLVGSMKYDLADKTLYVKMRRDGFVATYPNVPESLATMMYLEPGSVGKFARRFLWGRPYVGYHH